jgi:PPK2 family polyphosphate:nucleotide phosphotransferase
MQSPGSQPPQPAILLLFRRQTACYQSSIMAQPLKVTSKIRLRDFNPAYHAGLDKDKTREKTEKLCARLAGLQQLLYANRSHSVIMLLQGMDTSGKDGASRRVLEGVTPAGVEASEFKVPTPEELAHDFLWRIHQRVPRYGYIGVFNRSHYEDILAVRVLKLQPRSVWQARYTQINAFEKYLADNKVILLKFFLHISKGEQARRLQARLEDPAKNWKFELADIRSRSHWKAYQLAYEDAVNFCSTPFAPWHVVPADHKWYRDYVVARTMVETLEGLQMKWPRPKERISGIRIK